MKGKFTKFKILIVMLIIIGMALVSIPINAATWTGEPNVSGELALTYGEDTTTALVPEEFIVCYEHSEYAVNLNTSNEIVTGITGHTLTVNPLKIGTDTITVVSNKGAGCTEWTDEQTIYTTQIDVTCTYPQSLIDVVTALNGEMTATSLNGENIYATPTLNSLDAIIDTKVDYDELNANQKALVDSLISDKSEYATFTDLYNATLDYIETLANNFINNVEENGLKGNTTATRANYQTIINSETAYNNLNQNVTEKIDDLLVNTYNSTDYSTLLANAKAYEFIAKYDIDYTDTLTKEMDEKMLSSQEEWETLDADVQTAVETIIGKDYETWMEAVQDDLDQRNAEEFVHKYDLYDYDATKFDETTLDETNEQEANRIVGEALTEYNTLTDNAKTKTTPIIGSNFETIAAEAQNYLDALEAKRFIDNNSLETEFPTTITQIKALTEEEIINYENIANDMLEIETAFNALSSDAVREKVLNKLGINNIQVLVNGAQNYLDTLEAKRFIDNNRLETEFPATMEAIAALTEEEQENYKNIATNVVGLEDDFEGLTSDAVREKVLNELGVATFDEIIEGAQNYLDTLEAKKFIDNNSLETEFPATIEAIEALTEEEIINYENIANDMLEIETAFNALSSDAVREKVLNKLGINNIQVLVNGAQNYLDTLEAKRFIDNNRLQTEFPETMEAIAALTEEEQESYKNIATSIVGLEDEFEGLSSDAVREKVLNKLGVATFDEIIEGAQNYLDTLEAKRFIDNNNLETEFPATINEVNGLTEDEIQEYKDIATNILDSEDEFNAISERAKGKVLEQLNVTTYQQVIDKAQDYIDILNAKEFIDENNLMAVVNSEIGQEIINANNNIIETAGLSSEAKASTVLTKEIAQNALTLKDDFENLSENAQAKVLEQLGINDFDTVIEIAQAFLDETAAQEFYDKYLEGLDEEKIISGQEEWNSSSQEIKTRINRLLNENGIDSTYPELVQKAKDTLDERAAQKFIDDNLTLNDGSVIGKATNSNYKQIINAEDDYNALSDNVKEKVNAKLKQFSGTTYPELLLAAQQLQKTPKTGDKIWIPVTVLAVSTLGIAITIIRKR